MATTDFPRQGQGFRAEVKFGDNIHLGLMATHTGLGPAAAIFDAKQKAEARARRYCTAVDRKLEFPELRWTESG